MKLKKVKDTKNPTIKQMISMSENLRGLLNCYINIEITSKSFDHKEETDAGYGIYIASDGQPTHKFNSWEDLLSFYHELMEGASDES